MYTTMSYTYIYTYIINIHIATPRKKKRRAIWYIISVESRNLLI